MNIELNRTFVELSANAKSDDSDLLHIFNGGNPISWTDLLKSNRVVLLSEAGSGKTHEIRAMTRKLRTEGKHAFFMRLEQIAGDFETAFEEGTFEEFKTWRDSLGECWLFLDSVDEARLRSPRDFESAIRKIGQQLIAAMQRTHIVITGRSSAWRPVTDLVLCETKFPFEALPKIAEADKSANTHKQSTSKTQALNPQNETPFMIVSLKDLTRMQIAVFAHAKGVANANELFDAIERADAWSFASRPQDLSELIDFWASHHGIGSRSALMQNSINRRLKERDQDRADTHPLSSEKARQGAKFVAAAATMTHDQMIQVPDGSANKSGLPIKGILSEWDDVECAALLARPIFDAAVYGTVRFHHRSVREYLTAEWLADLLKQETSRLKIEELFFRKQYGLDVVVPVMRPVLPWLAIFDEKISKRILKVAPEVFFEGGDPSQLPLEIRREILHNACDRYASRAADRGIADYAANQRFANKDLAPEIKELLSKYAKNDELLSFLLHMVWHGNITEVVPEVKCVSLNPSSGRYARATAFRVIAALGTADEKTDLRQKFLTESVILNRDLTASLLEVTDPSPEAIEWLFAALPKVADTASNSSHREMPEQLYGFIERAAEPLLPSLIEGLSILFCQSPLIEHQPFNISAKYIWMARASALAIKRVISTRHASALSQAALAMMHGLRCALRVGQSSFNTDQTALAKPIHDWPELHMALFWYVVADARKRGNVNPKEPVGIPWGVWIDDTYVDFQESDFTNVLGEISKRTLADDKLIALSIAFSLASTDTGQSEERQQMFENAVKGCEVLAQRLAELMCPPKLSASELADRRKIEQQREKNENRKREEKDDREKWRRYLSENIESLRAPNLADPRDITSAWQYLYDRRRVAKREKPSDPAPDWELLADEFGIEVARAFRDGLVAYWRRNQPQLRSEGAPENQRLYATVIGLLGLAIEARETVNWPDTLTETDAEWAFRYAMFELNGFPTWLPKLFAKFSHLITNLSLKEITYELADDSQNRVSSYLLADVSYSGEWLWDAVAPQLFEMAEAKNLKNLDNLEYLLNIIQGSSISNEKIALLASEKALLQIGSEYVGRWFAVWVNVQPREAIAAFANNLAAIQSTENRTATAMIFAVQLFGGGRNKISQARQAFKTVAHLMSLYVLLREHIKQEDDIDRGGTGVYSPTLRDRAQDVRNDIYSMLKDIPGKESFIALEKLANLHPDESSRPWIKLQAKQRAEQDADNPPWSLNDLKKFNDKLERVPANHRDIFDLAVMHLLNLKNDLENGDSSNASILKKVTQEGEIRKYVGNWCRERAHGNYTVVQEEELADAKRPDFRFHRAEIDGPVPVELKLADNWTGPALFERLATQLSGDYLRDERSRRGIFLLVYRGEKKTWQLPNGNDYVNFEQLVKALQDYWSDISTSFPKIDEIRVIGIDLTARSIQPKLQNTTDDLEKLMP